MTHVLELENFESRGITARQRVYFALLTLLLGANADIHRLVADRGVPCVASGGR